MDIESLPTPALVIDGAIARRNIARMAEYGRIHGLAIRPHTKTHKSLRVAAMQLAAGAGGLTVAKIGEAETMAPLRADLLVAYPAFDPGRVVRLAWLARSLTVHVAIDSETAVSALGEAAEAAGSTIGILVDIDVGMGRTGVQSPADSLALAQCIAGTPGLGLDGIMIYPGHVWASPAAQEVALESVGKKIDDVIERWGRAGLEAKIVSGGSTPTALRSHVMTALTEIRPGTYVYNDMNTVRGGYCTLPDCAARIVCTVVSTAVPGQVVIDAGTKTLTSDRCIPAPESGHGYIVEYPEARIVKLSEEHGQIDVAACRNAPRIGERVTVVPNHVCPCVNLQSAIWWHEDGYIERIPVDARGLLS